MMLLREAELEIDFGDIGKQKKERLCKTSGLFFAVIGLVSKISESLE